MSTFILKGMISSFTQTYGKSSRFPTLTKINLVVGLLLISLISHGTDYYISNAGNDSNSGTSPENAWRTIDKVNSFSPSPGDKILFERGGEWTGTIKLNGSGTSGSPVVYGSYGSGAKPKIYNSEEISGWALHSGSIYKASFNSDIGQLFVNDVRMKLARYPNNGYFTTNSTNGSTTVTSSNLDGSINYSGAVWFGRVTEWNIYSEKVASSSGQTFNLSSSVGGIGSGEGFWLTNKLEFLDEPGEWYYDSSTNTVYLWMKNGDSPGNYEIRGSITNNAVTGAGKNYVRIQDLHLLHAGYSAVKLDNCDYITINGVDIDYPEQFGIDVPNTGSNNTTVTNSTVKGANRTGMSFNSPNSTFTNNTITDIGIPENMNRLSGDYLGMGIYSRADDCTITDNRIINTAYSSIHFWGERTMIKYNYSDRAMQHLGDGGAIYTYNGWNYSDPASAGSEIMYNIVLNATGNREGSTHKYDNGVGIYMDDNTHDVAIRYNTVHNCNAGIYLHIAGNIDVQYNNISDCNVMFLSQGEAADSYIKNNTVYAYNETDDFIWWQDDPQRFVKEDGASPVYDHNSYYNHYNDQNIFNNWSDWNEWQANGDDPNSSFDNSRLAEGEIEELFYNATKQNKTISLGSTVYKDLDGISVSGTLTLEPFTSKILIKTNSETNFTNQSPSIQNQTLSTDGDLNAGEYIGQVAADDPDAGQSLHFEITGGNEEALFYIDSATGELFAQPTTQITVDKTVGLTVKVTDDATDPLSASATVSVNITAIETVVTEDTTAPAVTSFSVESSSSDYTVQVTSFEATDDNAVHSCLITDSPTVPLETDNSWSASAPTEFVCATEGKNTLYAWAKDAAGNISSPATATVNIALPDLSPTASEYLFEESSGLTVIDSKGSNDGTIVNEENRTAGVNGNGLQLTGSGHINIGEAFCSNVENEVTLSAWIKPDATSFGYQGIIMHGGPNIDSYALYIYNDSKRIGFKTTGTSSSWTQVDNINTLWDGQWHHLTVTYDGAEKIIYLDDEVLIRVPATGAIESGVGYNLYIGAGRDDTPASLLYNGLIDEVRIYNYALTSQEVSDLYNSHNTLTAVYAEEDISICEGENYNGWTTSGQYVRTIEASTGADSIVTTNLIVHPIYEITENVTINEGENYEGWMKSGQYQRTLESVYGCDSIVITNLTVIGTDGPTVIYTEEDIFICDGESYEGWTEPGQYQRTLSSFSGGDSIVSTNLYVNATYEISEDVTIQEGESYEGWSATGQYQRILTTINGCDSIVITNLTVLAQSQTHSIELEKGWNVFSSFVIPANPEMETIQDKLSNANMLNEVEDELGNKYERKGNEWINSIGNMQITEGYKIKVKNSSILTFEGASVSLPLDINLFEGTNLISFPYNGSVDAMQVIQPLIDAGALEKVQDEKGNSIEYWNESVGWVNNIGNFNAGEGYYVQVNKSCVLTVSDLHEKSEVIAKSELVTDYFTTGYEGNGSDHMNINIVGLAESGLQAGDEIAAFDGDICVGAVKLGDFNIESNVVSIRTSVTDEGLLNGFTEGNPISLLAWSYGDQEAIECNSTIIDGSLTYEKLGSVFVELHLTETTSIQDMESVEIDVYPNPADDQVTVRFEQQPEQGATIELTDLSGKQVISRVINSTLEVLDIASQPSGIYLVRITNGDYYTVKKLVVN